MQLVRLARFMHLPPRSLDGLPLPPLCPPMQARDKQMASPLPPLCFPYAGP